MVSLFFCVVAPAWSPIAGNNFLTPESELELPFTKTRALLVVKMALAKKANKSGGYLTLDVALKNHPVAAFPVADRPRFFGPVALFQALWPYPGML